MPVKAMRPKRRVSEAAELAAWETTFQTGYDFFGDLSFDNKEHTPEVRAAATEAWRRHGTRFLAARSESEADQVPWALETFGEPKCR